MSLRNVKIYFDALTEEAYTTSERDGLPEDVKERLIEVMSTRY